MERAFGGGIRVRSTDQLVDGCSAVIDAVPPSPACVAVIMYTSGTTKGSRCIDRVRQSADTDEHGREVASQILM